MEEEDKVAIKEVWENPQRSGGTEMRVERRNVGSTEEPTAVGGPDAGGRSGGRSRGGASVCRLWYTQLGLKRTTEVVSEKPGKDTKDESGGSRCC